MAGYRDITPGSELSDHPSYTQLLASAHRNACYSADSFLKRWPKYFPVIPMKLHSYFLITSANFDAEEELDPDPEKRDKVAWLVFET